MRSGNHVSPSHVFGPGTFQRIWQPAVGGEGARDVWEAMVRHSCGLGVAISSGSSAGMRDA